MQPLELAMSAEKKKERQGSGENAVAADATADGTAADNGAAYKRSGGCCY